MKIKAALLSVLFLILLLVCAQASATTTTVMMYMCGTDLQSDCVNDIYEMCSVDLPGNVNVVVQAGGAAEWDDSDLQPNAINRFAIGYLSFEDIQPLAAATWAARMRSSILFHGRPTPTLLTAIFSFSGITAAAPCGASALTKPPITTV